MRGLIWKTAAAAIALGAFGSPAVASTNLLPAHWSVIQTVGTVGTLRAGSPWGPGSSLGAQSSIIDGNFLPENTQWNSGSWWWDEDPSINAGPVRTTIQLDGVYTFDQFAAQADDNDSYLLEYWNGAAWAAAWSIPPVFTFGLVTRNSGVLPAITTDRFRFSATGGDNYYSLSELQAFGVRAVPEPATWAMMIMGFGIVGGAMRYRRRATAVNAY